MRDIQEHCTVVVWKKPAETSGLIESYILSFTRGDVSTTLETDATYHYYVIQPSDIPPGDGPVTVGVGIELFRLHKEA